MNTPTMPVKGCSQKCDQGRKCTCCIQGVDYITMEDADEELTLMQELRYQAIRTALLVVSVMLAGGVMGAVWHWVKA